MQNAKITYGIRILKGEYKGVVVDMHLDLDELEGVDVITDKLLEGKYYESISHPCDYWEVARRYIELFND